MDRFRRGLFSPVRLLLLEAVLGGRPGLLWEPDLLLEDPAGTPSPDYRRIYHLKGGR